MQCEEIQNLETFIQGAKTSDTKYFEVEGRKLKAWYEVSGKRYLHEFDASLRMELSVYENLKWESIAFTDHVLPYIDIKLPDSTVTRKYLSLEEKDEREMLEKLLAEQYHSVPDDLKEEFNLRAREHNKDNAALFSKYIVMHYLTRPERELVYSNRVRICDEVISRILDTFENERISVYANKLLRNDFTDLSFKPVQPIKMVVN